MSLWFLGQGYEGQGFGDFWFVWMKVVFQRWVMFGMMFGIDWVKKFCELVKF